MGRKVPWLGAQPTRMGEMLAGGTGLQRCQQALALHPLESLGSPRNSSIRGAGGGSGGSGDGRPRWGSCLQQEGWGAPGCGSMKAGPPPQSPSPIHLPASGLRRCPRGPQGPPCQAEKGACWQLAVGMESARSRGQQVPVQSHPHQKSVLVQSHPHQKSVLVQSHPHQQSPAKQPAASWCSGAGGTFPVSPAQPPSTPG